MPIMNGAQAAVVLEKICRARKSSSQCRWTVAPRSLAAAISVDLVLSKSDGITKLGEHLNALLAPVSSELN